MIYLLHYPLDCTNPQICQGSEIEIFKENSFITNYLSYEGSSGAPVFNYENNKVIGVHNAGYHNYNINKGKGLLI